MTTKPANGICVVALFEAAKATLVLFVGFGMLGLLHHNVQAMAKSLVAWLHLDPAGKYARIYVQAAGALTDGRLWLLSVGAAVSATVRFMMAYGLWQRWRWAEWLAVISGGIYIPFEVYGLMHGVAWPKVTVLIVNVLIVGYLGYGLARGIRRNRHVDLTQE